MVKHFNITISGKVQGIFFRATAKHKAEELGVSGWIQNRADGTVYLEAEGEMAQLSLLIDWCKIGPRRANVENVHFVPGDVMDFTGFEIK